MYFYFYDKFTQDKQYEVELTRIETRLIELGINGRVEKLSIFKNAKELIEDGIKKGAHTVVAVGDDSTFATVVSIVAAYDVSVGFIPLIQESRFAEVLGIPFGQEAANVLSQRLVQDVDLGRIQDHHFLGTLYASEPSQLELKCDAQYTISTTEDTTELRIMNCGDIIGEEMRLMPAADGRIDIVVSPVVEEGMLRKKKVRQNEKESIFPVKHVEISSGSESVTLSADGVENFTTPCEVDVVPSAMKLIVGRDRKLRTN